MFPVSGHRRKNHALWALALLAWLGMVSMGMAHGMHGMARHAAHPPAQAAHAQGSAQPAPSHEGMHHGQATSGDCSMGTSCHCGSICYGVMLPQAPVLAGVTPASSHRIDPGASLPAGIGEPPLHPPSA